MTFPHLAGETPGFPGADVRVYEQYPNAFDYHRWAADTQMTLCSVPWDGTSNVVQWESDEDRDAWFAEVEGYRDTLQTEMRILPDGSLKVPLPFDASGLYNYVWVEFPVATSAATPLDHEPTNGIRSWGFFIDSMEYRSPSCTELRLTVDWWTTFEHRVSINSMQLARGHYAMANAASVADYLASPIAHTAWLQGAEPESVGERVNNLAQTVVVNPYSVVVLDVGGCDLQGSWESQVPGLAAHYMNLQRTIGPAMYAVTTGDFDTLTKNAPAGFWQCVRAIYISPMDCIVWGDAFTFAGVTLHLIVRGVLVSTDVPLSVEDFGYSSEYAGITKLYTSPYATVHLVSDSGQDVTIAPETLSGAQRIDKMLQVTAAGIRVMTFMQGVGSAKITPVSTQMLSTFSLDVGGDWQRTLMEWDIPCFAVYQSNQELTAWTKQFQRAQARLDASVSQSDRTDQAARTRDNATATALVAHTNANAQNQLGYDNTNDNATLTTTTAANSANNITSNNAATVAANNANTTANVNAANQGATASTNKLTLDTTSDLNSSYAGLNADLGEVAVTMSNNDARAQAAHVAQDASLVSSMASAVGSALTGNLGGAVEGLVSGVASTISTGQQIATDWQTANASAMVTATNNRTLYAAGVRNATEKGAHANSYTTTATSISNTAKSTINANNNSAATTIAANNANLTNANAQSTAATARGNALRSRDVMNQCADRTYDRNVANANDSYATAKAIIDRDYANDVSRIDNGIKTDDVAAPHTFGRVANVDSKAMRPMCVQVRVERGCDDDVARCGDAMLRYGYSCDRNVRDLSTLNVMPHFSYWQASEVWISADGKAPEGACDAMRGILTAGVTVWRKPEEVGKVSIYDN